MIGITGGSGAGKTILAQKLQDYFSEDSCLTLHQDDYYFTLPPDANFDVPEAINTALLTEHIIQLRQGKPIPRHKYDFVTCNSHIEGTLLPKSIILVEGFLLLIDSHLRELLDFSLFIDEPEDILLIRQLQRDVIERNRPLEQVAAHYLEHVRPSYLQYVIPTKPYATSAASGIESFTIIQTFIESHL